MRIRFGIALVCLGISSGAAQTQTAKDSFTDGLIDQQVYLRNFSAQSRVTAHWDGSKVVVDKPFVQMLAAVTVKQVKVKSDEIEIDGVRNQVVKDAVKGLGLAPAPSRVKILVKLNDGDAAIVLPLLGDALFFKSVDDAIAALPKNFLISLPRLDPSKPKPPSPDTAAPTCDCADVAVEKCRENHLRITGRMPPKLLKQVEPDYSDEALTAKKLSGQSTLFVKLNESGTPTFLWVSGALGYGLDENAAVAVSHYQFKPASCHGTPIPYDLYIAVNFRLF